MKKEHIIILVLVGIAVLLIISNPQFQIATGIGLSPQDRASIASGKAQVDAYNQALSKGIIIG